MNPEQVVPEVRDLYELIKERQDAVMSYDLVDKLVVEIEYLQFPEGWTNSNNTRYGNVIFDLSPTYPRRQPKVYVSQDMQYEGERPHVLYRKSSGPPGFTKYCIHTLPAWDPSKHGLKKMFEILEISLENPRSKNPLKEA